jgi:hypothetical protein
MQPAALLFGLGYWGNFFAKNEHKSMQMTSHSASLLVSYRRYRRDLAPLLDRDEDARCFATLALVTARPPTRVNMEAFSLATTAAQLRRSGEPGPLIKLKQKLSLKVTKKSRQPKNNSSEVAYSACCAQPITRETTAPKICGKL